MEWQPIETAPKDGTLIDLWVVNHLTWNKRGRRVIDRKWGPCINWMGQEHDGWALSEDDEPTHWMQPPKPPGDEQ